jgi:hypothetical protein
MGRLTRLQSRACLPCIVSAGYASGRLSTCLALNRSARRTRTRPCDRDHVSSRLASRSARVTGAVLEAAASIKL